MSWKIRSESDAAKRRAYDCRMSGGARTSDGVAGAFHIAMEDLPALYERFPELDEAQNTDERERAKAWKRWQKNSASEPYRLRTKL